MLIVPVELLTAQSELGNFTGGFEILGQVLFELVRDESGQVAVNCGQFGAGLVGFDARGNLVRSMEKGSEM